MCNVYFGPKLTNCGNTIIVFVTGLLIFLVLGNIASAASGEDNNSKKIELKFDYSGYSHNALVYVPEIDSPGQKYPVIITISGIGENAHRFVRATGFQKLASRYGFIAAFPQIDKNSQWSEWLIPSRDRPNRAAEYIRAFLAKISEIYPIQRQQIYLVGFSVGGMLGLTAMCDLTTDIAAFAIVSASLPREWQTHCVARTTAPLLLIASRDDPVFPWTGGKVTIPFTDMNKLDVLPVNDTVEIWRRNNKCNTRPVMEPLANLDAEDGTTVTRMRYDFGCRNDSPVLLYAVTGGGHSWPGSTIRLKSFDGIISQDFRASETVWEFVKKYRLAR